MADDYSGEVDEIIEDTLTGGDGDDSIEREVSDSLGSDKDTQGDSEDSGSAGHGSTSSIQHAKARREELWEELNRPPDPENIVSHVCETLGLSESLQNEALDLVKKGNDAGLPIHRTRVVWSLSAIKQASEIHGEPVELREIADFTDMNRRGIEDRSEDFRDLS